MCSPSAPLLYIHRTPTGRGSERASITRVFWGRQVLGGEGTQWLPAPLPPQERAARDASCWDLGGRQACLHQRGKEEQPPLGLLQDNEWGSAVETCLQLACNLSLLPLETKSNDYPSNV